MELWERKERVGAKENRVVRTMSAHCHHCYTNFLAIFARRCVHVRARPADGTWLGGVYATAGLGS